MFNAVCQNNVLAYAFTGLVMGFASNQLHKKEIKPSFSESIKDVISIATITSLVYGIIKLNSHIGLKYAANPKLAMLFKGLLYTGSVAAATCYTNFRMAEFEKKTEIQKKQGLTQ